MTRTLFVSDVHLRPDDDHRAFLSFLRGPAREASALYILGDLFDYWIGPRHLRASDYRSALREIREVANTVPIGFIPGNRDYFVDRKFEAATGMRLLGDSASIDLGGRRVLLAHGDFIYNRNPKYTAYRRLMRFQPLRTLYLSMPEKMSRGIARGFRKVSPKTTRPVVWTREDLVEEARPHFRKGFDVIVCGHIHAPQHVATEYRGRTRDVYILGDWDGGTQDYLEWDGKFRLRSYEA